MRKSDVDRFFRELSRSVRVPVKVYLTGGIASWFWGGERPTADIDFGLKAVQGRGEVGDLIVETSRRLSIPVQFSEDISRWGMVGIRHYEKGARLHRRFGQVAVYLLDPMIWSIGKISRYYQSDVADLVAVFRKQKPAPGEVVQCWCRALRESPKSTAQLLFKKTAEDFLTTYGVAVWGRKFKPAKYVRKLRQATLS